MIKPKCDKCGEELQAYGALAFSPPDTLPDESPSRQVDKIHICVKCWKLTLAWLKAPATYEATHAINIQLRAERDQLRSVADELAAAVNTGNVYGYGLRIGDTALFLYNQLPHVIERETK